jgi:predicted DNA-binding protein (UPF0251 family)
MKNTHRFYAVLTGDVVRSTELPLSKRKRLPKLIAAAFRRVQEYAGEKIVSELAIFQGDSFQFVISDPAIALRAALILYTFLRSSDEMPEIEARIAIGIGRIDFLPQKLGDQGGGEAFQLSGRLLNGMRKEQRIVITTPIPNLNTEFAILHDVINYLISTWTIKQAESVHLRLLNISQAQAAEQLNISQSAVSQRLASAGFALIESTLAFIEGKFKDLISIHTGTQGDQEA